MISKHLLNFWMGEKIYDGMSKTGLRYTEEELEKFGKDIIEARKRIEQEETRIGRDHFTVRLKSSLDGAQGSVYPHPLINNNAVIGTRSHAKDHFQRVVKQEARFEADSKRSVSDVLLTIDVRIF